MSPLAAAGSAKLDVSAAAEVAGALVVVLDSDVFQVAVAEVVAVAVTVAVFVSVADADEVSWGAGLLDPTAVISVTFFCLPSDATVATVAAVKADAAVTVDAEAESEAADEGSGDYQSTVLYLTAEVVFLAPAADP